MNDLEMEFIVIAKICDAIYFERSEMRDDGPETVFSPHQGEFRCIHLQRDCSRVRQAEAKAAAIIPCNVNHLSLNR